MTAPATITPAERRAATLADLAHAVGKHLPPDPGLMFQVDLRMRRRPIRIVQQPGAQMGRTT